MHNRWHPDIPPVVTVEPGEALTLECEDGHRRPAHARQRARRLRAARPRPRAPARRARRGRRCEARRRPRGRVPRVPPGRLRRHGGDPRLRLPRRPLHRAVPRQVGDRGRRRPLGRAAGRRRARRTCSPASSAWRRRRSGSRRSGSARSGSRARAGPVAESAPESAIPPRGRRRAADDPAARDRRQPRHPPARRRQPALPARRRAGRAASPIGDLHFAQGDGEVCGTAIEVAGSVTVALHVHRDHVRRSPLPDATRRPRARAGARSPRPASRSTTRWISRSQPARR